MVSGRGRTAFRSSSSRVALALKKAPAFFLLFIVISSSVAFLLVVSVLQKQNVPDLRDARSNQGQNVFHEDGEEWLWRVPLSRKLRPCTKPTRSYTAPEDWDRYITVRSNGGLNQMRTGICDMVAVARMLNATLVIPQLDRKSFWQDSSSFSDIFDEEHFIATLKGDVRIVKELPKELESVPKARKHFTSWSSKSYYEDIAQLWKTYKVGGWVVAIYRDTGKIKRSHSFVAAWIFVVFFYTVVIHVPKSDSRLSNNDVPLDIQRLRCRAMYYALRFSRPIEEIGMKLVERLRSHGKYIALHLRYEKDMLSFTGCTYGLTDNEAKELSIMRQNTNHWKTKQINSTEQRIGGNCPLTPKEVGIFLRALGYPSSTLIYIAAGEIYGGDRHLAELKSYFPNLYFKETVAMPEELEVFASHASQTAAIDYIVSVESDVFVPSYSGNMARAVEGHRRFLGHRMTISPDRKGLVELFDKTEAGELKEGPFFSSLVSQMHKSRLGTPRERKGPLPGVKGRARLRTEESFYENPFPECICKTGHTHMA